MLYVHLLLTLLFGIILPGIKPFRAFRNFFYFISIIIILKTIFFTTSAGWKIHDSLVGPLDLRGRQKQTLSLINKARSPRPDIKYVPFGNSQVGFIFNKRRISEYQEYEAVAIPGLRIVEYNFFVEDILKLNPKCVVLYLSDKTIAATPDIYPVGVRPVNLSLLWSLYKKLKTAKLKPNINHYIEISLGELFYTFKYDHLFKAYRNHYLLNLGNKSFFEFEENVLDREDLQEEDISLAPCKINGIPVLLSQVPSKTKKKDSKANKQKDRKDIDQRRENIQKRIKKRVQNLAKRKRREFNNRNVAFNLKELESFANTLRENGINLVIVEGHYHPDAYETKPEITQYVAEKLDSFTQARYDAIFIPRSELPNLVAGHYKDETHLHPGPSDEMFDAINKHLNNLTLNGL